LPSLLEIPTGLGKTAAVVLAWIWRRRFAAETIRGRAPRRLVYCLPMRVLVEQTRSSAVRWLNNLDLLAGTAAFEGERLIRYDADWSAPNKIAVVTLMGGESQGDWREHPELEAIIVGTQDMLLSRALNRGFAMAPQLWPVDFGFVNVDALWVMDEVQLMGPARTTSIQLQQFWDEAPPIYVSRQTLWTSATLGAKADSTELPNWMRSPELAGRVLLAPPHRHDEKDLQHVEFSARWRAPKRLEAHLDLGTSPTKMTTRQKRKRVASATPTDEPYGLTLDDDDLRDRILDSAQDGRLVLVFVNQVKRAHELHDRLLDGVEQRDPRPEVRLVHARMRPRDRKTIEAMLQDPTPATGRIVVATQVLEAGVDIDADVVFTELCPWPSLVQRLGRLNRSGTRPRAEDVASGKQPPATAIVFEPPWLPRKEDESEKDYLERRSLPYDPLGLDESRRLLMTVAADYDGSVSPETLANLPVSLPLEGPVLRRFDLDDLFDTDPDLAGGHADVTPFLRAADRDLDAYLLWRRIGGGLPPDEQVPLHRDELCAVPFYEAQDSFADRDVWILTLATGRRGRAAWRLARGGDIHAGDTVMVDLAAGCYGEREGWLPNGKGSHPTVIVDRWDMGELRLRAWVEITGKDHHRTRIDDIDAHVVGIRARDQDPRSFGKVWTELTPHLVAAEDAASKLVTAVSLPDTLQNSVKSAVRWHDVGKALERDMNGETRRPFQHMLITAGVPEDGHPRPGALYAKSNRRGGIPSGFRHELASLLAFLAADDSNDDLAAFLILSHHGKVRLLPSAWNDDGPPDLCGVREGDRIPGVALPDKATHTIVLDTKMLLPSRQRRGWQGRVRRLLASHGPFVLAYLEGLVRVADWRAGE
jgi:CRISPR-associated endonuclease/helicase Cas3